MKLLNQKRPVLLSFLMLAALWQALGALGYMIVFATHPAAPLFYGIVKGVMFVLPLIGLWLGIRTTPMFKDCDKQDIFISVGFGSVLFLGVVGVYTLFPSIFVSAAAEALPRATVFGLATPATFLFAGVLFSIMHSFFEEYYWRWFIFSGLTSFVSTVWAIIISSIAFSLHHIFILLPFVSAPLAVVGGLMVGVVGGIWSFIYLKRKNLLAPWISHIAADLAIVFVIYQILFNV